METLRIKVALLQQEIILEQVGAPSEITHSSFVFSLGPNSQQLAMTGVLTRSCPVFQALSNILSPQLLSMVPGRGCPDISVLRDVYSLLGEGGQRFPAIVLDSESQ